jgi:hypothetical protein
MTYSARGLHALLATMLARYRLEADPGSEPCSPRALVVALHRASNNSSQG